MRLGGAGTDRPRRRAFERPALGTAGGCFDARQWRGVVPLAFRMPDVIGAADHAALRPGVDDFDAYRVMNAEMRVERVRRAPRTESHAANADVAAGDATHRQRDTVDGEDVTF